MNKSNKLTEENLKDSLIFLSIFIFIVASKSHSQSNFDTLFTTTIGPGVIHTHVVNYIIPLNINVVEIDLENPYINMETVKSKDLFEGYERTSAMSKRLDSEGHRSVCAINGDFYATGGIPINSQIINGKLLRTVEFNNKSTIGFDIDDNPVLSVTNFNGTVITKNGSRGISGVNKSRDENQLIFYNEFWGDNTRTNQWGTEIGISPLSGWIVNDTIVCVAGSIENLIGKMSLSKGNAVLSGHNQSSDFLYNNIQIGDTIKLVLGLQPALPKLYQLLGGFPRIIKGGNNYVSTGYPEEGGASTFHTALHPRSAAGFSSDSSKFYFVTVDGRQALSAGIDLFDLADFMIQIGIHEGVNLDGGGSTTMVVRNEVRNLPSDGGGERSVANCMLAASSPPLGDLTYLQIEPDNYSLFRGESVQFFSSGWDQYYNKNPITFNNINYAVDSSLGNITDEGLFIATHNGGQGYVYCIYNDIKDSAFVHIMGIKQISITPKVAVTDTLKSIEFNIISIDENDKEQLLTPNSYEWKVLDTDVGLIDSMGVFQGLMQGATKVVVHYVELSDTAEVRVEIGSGQMLLDSLDTGLNWKLKVEYMDTMATSMSIIDTPRTFGNKAIKVNYKFTRLSTERSWIHLESDIPIYGIPEFIDFDFKSDGQKHRAYIYAYDSEGNLFKNIISKYATEATRYDTLRAKTANFRSEGEDVDFHFPIRLQSIRVKLGYYSELNEINEGSVFFDNLRVVYPELTSIIPFTRSGYPSSIHLYQNYPNPFNPKTTIKFETISNGKVELTVYDLLGRTVETLINQDLNAGYHQVDWDAGSLASGVYVYRLLANGQTQNKKMVLIR